jgi:hypothetical protein
MKLTDMDATTIAWFLEELAASEVEYFETGMLEIVISDKEGNEGTTDVLVVELAAAASLLIKKQESELETLRALTSSTEDWDDIMTWTIRRKFKNLDSNNNHTARTLYRTGNMLCIKHAISRCQVCTHEAYAEAEIIRSK